MPRGRITKISVDNLECPEGKDRIFLWDNALAGFGVVAFPTGKKTYVLQFRRDGRSKRTLLGDHGRLTPDEARREAKKVLGDIERGADPAEARRRARQVRTVKEAAADFLASKPRLKASTQTAYKDLLDRVILPSLGNLRLADVTPRDVAKMHKKWSGSPFTANRAVATLSSMWTWLANLEEVDRSVNPVRGIERYDERPRERYLTSEELGRLGEALSEAETKGLEWRLNPDADTRRLPRTESRRTRVDPHAVGAIRLLILTGARLREILDAKWEHVDLERGIIHLPDSKTGAKPVYLSAAAMAVLDSLPRIARNPHIIPGAKKGAPRADLKKPWARITEAAGLDGLRLHDLRHTFASIGAGASLGLPIVGKLLGHSQPSTTARYAHLDADPMRRAVETIGRRIIGVLDPLDRQPGEKHL